jgi:hypothetical protein
VWLLARSPGALEFHSKTTASDHHLTVPPNELRRDLRRLRRRHHLARVKAKWMRLDDLFIGTWVQHVVEWLFTFTVPDERS